MPTRLRKTRKYRGSRQCGWGQVAQHRGSGSRGGFGKAGLDKHKWTWTVKYDPDHFGGNVFKPPRRKTLPKWINVGELNDLWNKMQGDGDKGKKELNLTRLGYAKLLGKGEIRGSYRIVVGSCSRSALEKIQKAGGELVTGSEQ